MCEVFLACDGSLRALREGQTGKEEFTVVNAVREFRAPWEHAGGVLSTCRVLLKVRLDT